MNALPEQGMRRVSLERVTAPLGLTAPGLAALCSPAPGRFSSAEKLFIFQCS